MNDQENLFPLMIDLTGKRIVIIGSGKVAKRKAVLLSEYGEVCVVDSGFNGEFQQMEVDGHIKLLSMNIEQLSDQQYTDVIAGCFLVIPATSNKQLNNRISELAKQSGVMTNRVDTVGEVLIPSVFHQGDMVIGISTKGTSPALSRFTRKKIEALITPQYADMARLQNEMREHFKSRIRSQAKRKQLLRDILNNKKIWSALSESYTKALNIAKGVNSSES